MAWLGLAWLGLAWLGLAWLGLAWLVIDTRYILQYTFFIIFINIY
ncbi:hypothetical protein OFS07_06805 [Brachyspira hyodysenteriae]|nr:hypothetical protein [Brachyspira hyodysenteriae]MCZ9924311.1 hypothetical protein [Brachyspira hyodysenteriae]MDA0065982.1 hypothetical protein [Brachyspira hyodysenteriae]MDA0095192.1 hypothetical protein [Brachyspira hyodysenteriae]